MMAGNSPELKLQKKVVIVCYKVESITQEKVEKEKPMRCSEHSFQKFNFATLKRIFLVFYYLLNECDIHRLLPAHLSTENTFYLAI